MIRRLIPVLAAMAAFAPLPAPAQAGCDAPATQMAMNACAGAALQAADDALNAVYKQAAGAAKLQGGAAPDLLLTAQRAWITYRDAACAAETAPFAGGSIAPMVQAGCLERLTRQRSDDLRAAYLEN